VINGSVMFMDCPAYTDAHGTLRCGLPAVVEDRYAVESSDGPLESARIRCPRGHFFNGPLEFLTWERSAQPGVHELLGESAHHIDANPSAH
jgi:hypothetical protein